MRRSVGVGIGGIGGVRVTGYLSPYRSVGAGIRGIGVTGYLSLQRCVSVGSGETSNQTAIVGAKLFGYSIFIESRKVDGF